MKALSVHGSMTDLRRSFLDQAAWAADTSPLYERICRIVADDSELLALASEAPPERARDKVFLAAVHAELLDGVDHPLAAYYPSVSDESRSPDDELADALRDFCLTHADALRERLATRRTQTNAVRRSAVLYPAFAHVAARTDGPLTLVELGPSAGLNLLWDRYQYGYDWGDETRHAGSEHSSVAITSSVRAGRPPLPLDPPAVHSRVGIDLHPLDVTDEADVAWLRALTWPEHHDRRAVLADAVAVARSDPPRLVEGDMLDQLPAVLDEIPDDVPVVVYSTLVCYQVPETVRAELRDLLAERASERPLHWLTGSAGHDDPGDGIGLDWHRSVDGDLRTDRLATFQPHGEWIEWHGVDET